MHITDVTDSIRTKAETVSWVDYWSSIDNDDGKQMMTFVAA